MIFKRVEKVKIASKNSYFCSSVLTTKTNAINGKFFVHDFTLHWYNGEFPSVRKENGELQQFLSLDLETGFTTSPYACLRHQTS